MSLEVGEQPIMSVSPYTLWKYKENINIQEIDYV